MNKYRKEIKIDAKKDICYTINPGYADIHTINFNDDTDFSKHMEFCRWDDYSFKSWYNVDYDEYEKLKKESYVFENSNPLYIPLFHLLKGEEELIIDDDETDEINKKYMRIYLAEDSSIKIDFINDLEKDDLLDKFSVFVKNIGSDYRSKVDYCNMDTKERLFFFFEEVYDLFEEEYHQVTIEENLADNGLLTKEESKKYVKELSIFKNKDF